ncbi:MAG: hypothetical protein L0956_05395 [Candidatus Mariimomonas ferrooxydans]
MEEQIPLVGIIQDKQAAPLPLEGRRLAEERGGLGWGWTKELSRNIVNIAKTLRKRAEKCSHSFAYAKLNMGTTVSRF